MTAVLALLLPAVAIEVALGSKSLEPLHSPPGHKGRHLQLPKFFRSKRALQDHCYSYHEDLEDETYDQPFLDWLFSWARAPDAHSSQFATSSGTGFSYHAGRIVQPKDPSAWLGPRDLRMKKPNMTVNIWDGRLGIPGKTRGEWIERDSMVWETTIGYTHSTRHSKLNFNFTLELVLPHLDWLEDHQKDPENHVRDRLSPYLYALGQMPRCLLRRIERIHFLTGHMRWSSVGKFITLHTGKAYGNGRAWWHGVPAWWATLGMEEGKEKEDLKEKTRFELAHSGMEEILLHELAHSGLDAGTALFNEEDWEAAKKQDCGRYVTEYHARRPVSEARSETFPLYFAYRFRRSRLPKHVVKFLEDIMPNRIKYFDSLHQDKCCDMTPPRSHHRFCEKLDWRSRDANDPLASARNHAALPIEDERCNSGSGALERFYTDNSTNLYEQYKEQGCEEPEEEESWIDWITR